MRWFRAALPATAFFVLLCSAAGVGYWFGMQRAGAGASKSTTVLRVGDACSLSTCPITGKKLGSMGDPVVKLYDGREVRETLTVFAATKPVAAYGPTLIGERQ